MSEYLDFELQFSALSDGRHRIAARTPAGEASGTIALPLADSGFQTLSERLARLDVDEAVLTMIGRRLFEDLFRGDLLQMYAASRGLLADDQQLRFLLHIAPDDIAAAALPWETLYDPDRGPLALLDTALVRYVPLKTRRRSLTAELPLRVLLTSAQTPPLADFGREIAAITQALGVLGDQVEIVTEPHLTSAKLRQRLAETFHVWHFVGHGGFSERGQTCHLCLEDASGDADPISAAELAIFLNRSSLHLVVLDTCEGGRLATDPFRALAPALVRAEVPAVIAMQFQADLAASRAFAGEFYRGLGAGRPIERCVTEARRTVMDLVGLGHADWCTPVMYARVADGQIWQVRRSTQAPAAQALSVGAPAGAQPADAPPVGEMVRAIEHELSRARARIDDLTMYKSLHDALQRLESCYGPIHLSLYEGSRQIADEQIRWDLIESTEPLLTAAIDHVLDVARQASGADRLPLWAAKLASAPEDVQRAIGGPDAPLLRGVDRRITDTLGRQLSRLNTQMVETAGDLDLSQVLHELDALAAALPTTAPQRATIAQHHDALRDLSRRLVEAIDLHDRFQEVDDELRLLEGQIDQDVRELAENWQRLRPRIPDLCAGVSSMWAVRLLKTHTDLDTAVSNPEPRQLRRLFLSYRSQASRGFNQVDKELLELCAQPHTIGERLVTALQLLYAAESRPWPTHL